MSTCNWLDLQTLGFQPIMTKILPDHWSGPLSIILRVVIFVRFPLKKIVNTFQKPIYQCISIESSALEYHTIKIIVYTFHMSSI